jgi:hypothetical protein
LGQWFNVGQVFNCRLQKDWRAENLPIILLADALLLCSNSFLGLLLAEGLVLFFAFEAHGMMIRSVNPNLQLEQSTTRNSSYQ